MARHTQPEAPAPVARLVPSRTSFDFLEGSFAAAQRARHISFGVVVVSVVVLAMLALMGVTGLVDKQSGSAVLAQTTATNNAALAELAKIDNAGGLSADELTAHVTERQGALKTAVGSEVDVVGLLSRIRNSAPPGVDITSVTFHDPASATANTAPAATAPADPNDPAAATASPAPAETTPAAPAATPAPGAAAAPAAADFGTVEITGTLSDFTLIGVWSQAVGAIPGLSAVDPTWSGGGGAISTTLTATITQDGLTQRAHTLVAGGGN